MVEILIQFRIDVRLKDVFEHRKLAFFLGTEGHRVIKYFSIPVAKNVG